MKSLVLSAMLALSIATTSISKELYCKVVAKVDTERFEKEGYFVPYTSKQLQKHHYAVVIRDKGDTNSEVGRCSFEARKDRVTCDFYEVDYIARDSYVGHNKYFYFRGQYDVQVFATMNFVENNGRGSIAYGNCEEIN
ncbi:MAG: hypothetical protein P1U53_01175 [Sulfitobacter sp.]|nr:hypothetical protein [Sulfitobacter sp.]